MTQRSKFLKWVVAGAIVIVLNLFFSYAIRVFYKEPQYDTFCKVSEVVEQLDTKEACLKVGGQWNANIVPGDVTGPTTKPLGYCDRDFTCRQAHQDALSLYNRNIFIVLVVLGVISIGASFLVTSYEAVSLGFSLGGVLSFVIASIRYWSDMNDYTRVIVLGVALAALVWLGIKKISDN
jgi:hypothetical protein